MDEYFCSDIEQSDKVWIELAGKTAHDPKMAIQFSHVILFHCKNDIEGCVVAFVRDRSLGNQTVALEEMQLQHGDSFG